MRRFHITLIPLVSVLSATLVAIPGMWAERAAAASGPTPSWTPGTAGVTAPGGKWLVDSYGRRLLLTGVNLVEKCSAHVRPDMNYAGTPCLPTGPAAAGTVPYVLTPTAADPGRRFTDGDAQTLQNLGIDTVRLGIIWDGLEPGPANAKVNDPRWCTPLGPGVDPKPLMGTASVYSATVASNYLKRVDVIVNLLARHGIRVLIDMHQDAWGGAFGAVGSHWHGEGAPLWATCDNGLPSIGGPNFAAGYADLAEETAFGHFWANDVNGNLQGEFARVWSVVAQHFRYNPWVLGYDVFNEPADVSLITGTFGQKLQCFYAGTALASGACAVGLAHFNPGIIPVIQRADPHHVVFVEPPVLQDFGVPNTFGLTSLPFRNIALSFHDYGLSGGFIPGTTACTTPTCPVEESNSMALTMLQRSMIKTSQQGGPAALMSEFGATRDVATTNRVANLADRNLVSWMFWAGFQLHDPTGGTAEGLIDDNTRKPYPALAATIARPHAAAVAGTPTAQSFNMSTQDYRLTWTPDRAVSAPTWIRVPVLYHYAHGFAVRVSGGHTVRRTSTGDIYVAANGAGPVTVVISPLAR